MQDIRDIDKSILDQGRAEVLDLNNVSLNATTESSMKLLILYARETLDEFKSVLNLNVINLKERLDIVIPKMSNLTDKYWKSERRSIGPLQQWTEWKDYSKSLYKLLNSIIRDISDHLEIDED